MDGNEYSDTKAELAGSRRYAMFAFLRPSLDPTFFEQIIDKEFPVGIVIGVNQRVAERVASCHEGLNLTLGLLREFGEGAQFPERTALLVAISMKAVEHMEATQYSLVFRQYQSSLVLLRAALDAAAMIRFLSQDARRIQKWVRLTMVPGKSQSLKDRQEVRRMESRARESFFKALEPTGSTAFEWQRRMLNAMAHPNFWSLMVTMELDEEAADVPLRDADASLLGEIRQLFERLPMGKESSVVYTNPVLERLRIWEVYASFMLFNVLIVHRTVTDVTGAPKETCILSR